ncbi:MAG: hypothetical protein U5K71_01150 [Gracilimonas sp.]|nr:hypothetical protein [Gracilimonas sp.]
MNEFTLNKIKGSKDSLTGRLTFTQTKEFKIGMVIYFIFYMGATLADDFGYDWFVIPGFILAFISFGLAYIPFSYSRNFGKVILQDDGIKLKPKKDRNDFPDSPIDLTEITELKINIIQSFRWWSSYVIMQFIVKQENDEASFGLTIKNRGEENRYLKILDRWYKAGYPVKEYHLGQRIFKLNEGKNYADIQRIKQEYGLDWQ